MLPESSQIRQDNRGAWLDAVRELTAASTEQQEHCAIYMCECASRAEERAQLIHQWLVMKYESAELKYCFFFLIQCRQMVVEKSRTTLPGKRLKFSPITGPGRLMRTALLRIADEFQLRSSAAKQTGNVENSSAEKSSNPHIRWVSCVRTIL